MQILKKRIAGLRLFLSFQGIGRYLKKFFCKFLPNLATWILFSLSFSSPPSRKCLIVIVYYFVIQAIFLRPLILLVFSLSYLLCKKKLCSPRLQICLTLLMVITKEKRFEPQVFLLKISKSCQSIKLQNFKHIYYVLNKISSPQSNLSRQNN